MHIEIGHTLNDTIPIQRMKIMELKKIIIKILIKIFSDIINNARDNSFI